MPGTLNASIEISARESPAVVNALYLEQAARHAIDRIRGELLPEVNLEASYGRRFDPSSSTEVAERPPLRGA